MKKIEIPKFLCIDFVNSKFPEDKVIKGLVKSFIRKLKGDEERFDERPLTMRWEKIVGSRKEYLVEIKKVMKQFIHYSILNSQSGSGTEPEMNVDFNRIRHYLRNKAEKYNDPEYDPGDIYHKINFDVVNNLMIPGLCWDLIEFDKKNYWDRMIYCSECEKVFITRTLRIQNFCSPKCRFRYHNREKVKSGRHKIYMKEWRAKSR